MAKKLFRRQSRALVVNPSLAIHVKYVLLSLSLPLKLVQRTFSVHMSRSNAPELVKLLPLLPNLDTLEVFSEDYTEPTTKCSFKSVKLPQIRTLVIDSHTHYLMRCCAHAKRVIIHQGGFDIRYLGSIPFVADSLVYLALRFPSPENIRGMDTIPTVAE